MRFNLGFLAALLVLPMAAMAQFDDGGGSSSKPWDSFKLNPKTRLKLDFHNASVDMIVALYQKASGITIVKDPTLTGQLTITSAKAVPLGDAFDILRTTLGLKNFDLLKDGNLLVIRAKNQRGAGNPNPFGGNGMTGGMTFPQNSGNDQPVLRVYPITFANATQLARVLNDVFQQNAQNPFQFPGMGGPAFGGGGPGGRRGAMMAAAMGAGNATVNVKASADEYSNSVIVNAPTKDQRQVADLIKQLDKQTDQPQRSKVYKLIYADATDLTTVIQNVLTANAPKGRGATTTQQNNNPFGGFFGRFGANQNNTQVVADTRTNSLVATSTEENLVTVDRLVKELDTEMKTESSTFVVTLSNARADTVANLLYQAFGQRTGAGSTNRNTTNTNNRTTSTANSSTRRTTTPTGLGGNIPTSDVYAMQRGGAIPVDLADPNGGSGELRTDVGVNEQLNAQFFGFGGQNQNQNRQNTTNKTTARDANGKLVNVSDMTGQVTAIADTNTNSIIVVTSPQNAEMIKNILAQIDRIPDQVMIETIIVEATLDASNKLGVEWNQAFGMSRILGDPSAVGAAGTLFGDKAASPAEQGFRYTITGSKFNAFVNALQSDTKYQILSTPKIFTSNNTLATINISQSIPYLTSTRFDVNNNPTYSYSYLDVGIVLTVTPRITSNGFVMMDITQTANDLQGYTTFNAPIVNQREADTSVTVKDGETIILGGIIRKSVNSTVNKVPLLGDIPLLGNLFKSTSKHDIKTELMVFLTPRIVHDPAEAQRMRQKEEQKLSPSTRDEIDKSRAAGVANTPDPKKAPVKTNTNSNNGTGNKADTQ